METRRPVVVVTGSRGLIGSALIHRLLPFYTVIGCDLAGADRPEADAFVPIDVTESASVWRALGRVRENFGDRLASVVHLATDHRAAGRPTAEQRKVTLEGTARLLGALTTFDVEQLIFPSTTLVHAPTGPGERIDEASPIDAPTSFSDAKLRTERLLRAHRVGIPTLILRIADVYTDQAQEPSLVRRIDRIGRRDPNGPATPRDIQADHALVHVDDVTDAIFRGIARRRRLPSELTLLIGEPDPPADAELQNRIGELLRSRDWASVPVDRTRPRYALDLDRARRFLGWHATHHVMEMLPAILAARGRDPAAWARANEPVMPTERAGTAA